MEKIYFIIFERIVITRFVYYIGFILQFTNGMRLISFHRHFNIFIPKALFLNVIIWYDIRCITYFPIVH